MGVVVLLASLLWLSVPVSPVTADKKILLHFSYITAKTGVFVSSGGIPAVDLALELINNMPDILPNHTLNYTTILDSKVSDKHELQERLIQTMWWLLKTPHTLFFLLVYLISQCDVTAALDAFNQDFNYARRSSNQTYPTYVSLLCCGCSTATIPVAQISRYWNIPHVSIRFCSL